MEEGYGKQGILWRKMKENDIGDCLAIYERDSCGSSLSQGSSFA